jgi:hypothetical protein
MTDDEMPKLGRRAVLGAAIGGAAAVAAAALTTPSAVLGANGDPLNLGEDNYATSTTALLATGVHAFYAQADTGDALKGWTDGAGSSGVLGFATDPGGFGVYGQNGDRGVAALGTYDAALWASNVGYAAPFALKVAGKAKFSRSGKATVLKGKTYVDITVAGGLTSHSVIHATLQTYRTGVAIAAVRINYPSSGKARIYLTKVASTTASTYVGWFVAEY